MKHTPVLNLGPVSAVCGLSVITLLGLRSPAQPVHSQCTRAAHAASVPRWGGGGGGVSPCPKTTGSPSSSKRVRMRATSSATSCRHMPSGTVCGCSATCAIMLSRNCHSTTGGLTARNAGSTGATTRVARATGRCSQDAAHAGRRWRPQVAAESADRRRRGAWQERRRSSHLCFAAVTRLFLSEGDLQR